MFRVEQSCLHPGRIERRDSYVTESIDDTLQLCAALCKRQREQQFANRAHEVKCHENDGNCAPYCIIYAFSPNTLAEHGEGKRAFGLKVPTENLSITNQSACSIHLGGLIHLRERLLQLRVALRDVLAITRIDCDSAGLLRIRTMHLRPNAVVLVFDQGMDERVNPAALR